MPLKPNSSRMYFREKPAWKKGQEIMTARIALPTGGTKAVAHVYLDYDENRKPLYLACNSKGQELFPETANLAELVEQIEANEYRFLCDLGHSEQGIELGR